MGVFQLVRPSVPLHDLTPNYQGGTPIPWAFNYVSQIPESAVGWMVAQGWQITYVYNDTSTTPPTAYYSMARMRMNNLQILQQLVNTFTDAYNEGRQKNQLRYQDLVNCWYATVTATSDQCDLMGANSEGFYGWYAPTVSGLMAAIDAKILAANADIQTDAEAINTQLNAFLAKVADLETSYTAHLAKIETILDDESDALETYLSAYATQLAELATNYNTHLSAIRSLETSLTSSQTSHIASYTVQISALSTDFSAHDTLAKGYLTNLGTTELARINEKWDGELAAQLQELTTRGFYSSGMTAQIRDRNTVLRNREIADLNDRLNREKLENEHKLYEQKVALRARTMEGLDRIYQIRVALQAWKADNETRLQAEMVDEVIKIAEGIDRRHAMQQDALRNEAAQQDKELAEKQAATNGALDGLARYSTVMIGKAQYLVDSRLKLCSQQLEADLVRLKSHMDMRMDDKSLQQYQLDARNKLLEGFMSFMERRTDEYPNLEQLGNLATQLGDTGTTT